MSEKIDPFPELLRQYKTLIQTTNVDIKSRISQMFSNETVFSDMEKQLRYSIDELKLNADSQLQYNIAKTQYEANKRIELIRLYHDLIQEINKSTSMIDRLENLMICADLAQRICNIFNDTSVTKTVINTFLFTCAKVKAEK